MHKKIGSEISYSEHFQPFRIDHFWRLCKKCAELIISEHFANCAELTISEHFSKCAEMTISEHFAKIAKMPTNCNQMLFLLYLGHRRPYFGGIYEVTWEYISTYANEHLHAMEEVVS